MESKSKVGSKFYFTLPLEEDPPLLDLNAEAVGPESSRSHDFEQLLDSARVSERESLGFEESKSPLDRHGYLGLDPNRKRRGHTIDQQFIRLKSSPSRMINTIESLNNRLGRSQPPGS